MEGNSGPYLQYTYARASSILEKSLPEKETISWPFDHSERKVARVLIHYPEIVKDAANFYSPHILATYLFNLAQTFNSFYNAERVIGHERERTRLLLTRAMGSVIKNGLNLLGIEAPEKM
jgi:arginyl-tRNA synthetase